MLIVPTIYGYVIPGIAVNFMKKWKFHTRFRLGDYYAHHGFKYASNMNTWFFLASFHVNLADLTTLQMITLCITTGCIQGFIIWWHDTNLIKLGKLELKNVLVNDQMSAEEKAFTYAPVSFFIIGSMYATAALVGIEYVHGDLETLSFLGLIWIGFMIIAAPSSIAFHFLEKIKAVK